MSSPNILEEPDELMPKGETAVVGRRPVAANQEAAMRSLRGPRTYRTHIGRPIAVIRIRQLGVKGRRRESFKSARQTGAFFVAG